jgi:type II secretory pathway pseudopilin PulG
MERAIKAGGRRAGGFTLVELWFATAISVIVLTVVVSFSVYMSRSFAALGNYLDMERNSQRTMDMLTRDVRQAWGLAACDATRIVLKADTNGSQIIYQYSPENQTLSRLGEGTAQILLRDCRSLSFSNYQRNPIPGTFNQFPVATGPSEAKMVSVTWVCARHLTGQNTNSDSVQTAKIVMRKKQ